MTMNFPGIRSVPLFAAAVLAAATASFAQPITLGQKLKLEGIIVARDGETMALKTGDRGEVVVVLTENTAVAASKHRLGLIKQGMAATALVPGLKVRTEGLGDDKGRLIATKVSFTAGDLETAQAIQAGLSPIEGRLGATEQQVKANKEQIDKLSGEQANLARRFGELGDYDTKAEATVYFAVGSAEIGAEGQKDLAQLAENAKGLKGYMVQVAGYADASGNASVNQKLSHERSQAVVNWLAQNGGIPFVHMLAPGAMSTAQPAASNETAEGRAQNRRVVAKVLINRGIAGP
jgi:OmpA-OmpF porin, OOP family